MRIITISMIIIGASIAATYGVINAVAWWYNVLQDWKRPNTKDLFDD